MEEEGGQLLGHRATTKHLPAGTGAISSVKEDRCNLPSMF